VAYRATLDSGVQLGLADELKALHAEFYRGKGPVLRNVGPGPYNMGLLHGAPVRDMRIFRMSTGQRRTCKIQREHAEAIVRQ
jgi:hypothetical protein